MTLDVAEFAKVLKQPFERNAEPGDDVLIITDTEVADSVRTALFTAATQLDLDPTLTVMTPRKRDNNDPTRLIGEAMKESDVYVTAVSKALAHSRPSAAAQEAGKKLIIMSEISPDILRSGAAKANYDKMQRIADALGDIYAEGKEIRVTDDNGTDVVADIEDRTYWPSAGTASKRPEPPYACAFPDGEVGVCPAEGSTQGTVVWDTSLHDIGWLDEPIELEVEDGWVTNISGGKEAEQYRQILEEDGDENARYCAAEIALGINDGAEFSGRMRTDKKVYGSVHIATGDNIDIGGDIESDLHIDGVIGSPTVWVDDRKLAEDGEILIEPKEE
ncbi:aminopeptidase [Halorarum salinum]|uniref:Aminopeptidase n=1 Tax=Halorarum salinum TaxID=2743089 RepID=A0A7D5L7V0_9EURY|nr:aminopeptidase [Halobaculum salinum]QLG60286.1 aminopeptidase [Halobaculum salinum]